MDRAEIIAVVEGFLQNDAGLDDISIIQHDTDLIEAGILDSLLMVMLISHCEEHCGIDIDPEDLTEDNFRSLESIANYISSKF